MLWLVCLLLDVFLIAVFGRVLLSWFPLNPHGAMATVAGFFFVVTDPVMTRLRRILPPARFGGMALDFSPIILIIGISIIKGLLGCRGLLGL